MKSQSVPRWMTAYVAFVFFVAFDLFGLVDAEGIVGTLLSSKVLLAALCFAGMALFLFSKDGMKMRLLGGYFSAYYLGFTLAVSAVAFLTLSEFSNVDELRLLSRWASYMVISFVFIALVYCNMTNNGLFDLLYIMEIIATIGYFLYIVNAVWFQATGQLVFPGQAFLGDSEHASIRFFFVRLSMPMLFDFSTIASFVMWITRADTKGKIHFISFCLGFFSIAAISQSRAQIAAVLVALFVGIIIKYGHRHPILSTSLVVIGTLVVLALSGLLGDIIASVFYSDGFLDDSSMIRMLSVKYYIDIFIKNPLYGFGFITGSDSYYFLEHGAAGSYWLSDVGFFGQLAQWGILFAVIYILALGRGLYVIKKSWKYQTTCQKCLTASIYIYTIITSYSLIILSNTSGLCFSLFLIIYELVGSDSQNAKRYYDDSARVC